MFITHIDKTISIPEWKVAVIGMMIGSIIGMIIYLIAKSLFSDLFDTSSSLPI